MEDEIVDPSGDNFDYPQDTETSVPKQPPKSLSPTKKGYTKTSLYNYFNADRYLFFINFLLKKKGEYTSAVEFLREYDATLQSTNPRKTRDSVKKLYETLKAVSTGRYLFNGKAWFLKISPVLFIKEVPTQTIVRQEGKRFVVMDQPDVNKPPDSYDPLNVLFEVTAITRERVITLLQEEREKINAWKAMTKEEQEASSLESCMSPILTRLLADLADYAAAHHKGAIDRGFLALSPKKSVVDVSLRGSSDAYNRYIESTESNVKLLGLLHKSEIKDLGDTLHGLVIEEDDGNDLTIQTK